MKLILALALSGALFAALFVVPFSGRTLWQRAQAKGLPQSAARAVSGSAHAALRWAEEKRAHAGETESASLRKGTHKEVAHASQPSTNSRFAEAHARNGGTAPGAVGSDPATIGERSDVTPATAPIPRAAPAHPPAAHDHIVAAPPAEQLTSGERQSLDRLIAGSTHAR
jgi:hypothetical protein